MNAFTPAPASEPSMPDTEDACQMMTDALERLSAAERRSTAEILSELRQKFPNSPLAVRVRALEALRSRWRKVGRPSQSEIGLPHAVVGQ